MNSLKMSFGTNVEVWETLINWCIVHRNIELRIVVLQLLKWSVFQFQHNNPYCRFSYEPDIKLLQLFIYSHSNSMMVFSLNLKSFTNMPTVPIMRHSWYIITIVAYGFKILHSPFNIYQHVLKAKNIQINIWLLGISLKFLNWVYRRNLPQAASSDFTKIAKWRTIIF